MIELAVIQRSRKRRRGRGKKLSADELRQQTERRQFWAWQETFNNALNSLIAKSPDMPRLVERASSIADAATKVLAARRPKEMEGY